MDKFSLCWQGKVLGEIAVEAEPLYSSFAVRCRLPRQGLWCVWLVGECGELRLGVLEPQGDTAVLRRRFSNRMTASLGRLRRGELRRVASGEAEWEPMAGDVFRTPWLRQQLREKTGVLVRQTGSRRLLAIPYDGKTAFPLPAVFCFSVIRRIRGKEYAVFAFDEEEWPVF